MDNEVIVIQNKSIFDVMQDAICELDESIEERTGALEDIICEMDMANGGETV